VGDSAVAWPHLTLTLSAPKGGEGGVGRPTLNGTRI
jgi:hypothetical protein